MAPSSVVAATCLAVGTVVLSGCGSSSAGSPCETALPGVVAGTSHADSAFCSACTPSACGSLPGMTLNGVSVDAGSAHTMCTAARSQCDLLLAEAANTLAPAAKTGVHLGPRGVALLDVPGVLASKSGAHLGPSGVPLTQVTTMLNSGGSCPADFPVCYFDGGCVISSCADGCDWDSHNFIFLPGGSCTSDYGGHSAAVTCPANFPVCYYDGDCVLSSCANGCSWRSGSNYIFGNGHGGYPCTSSRMFTEVAEVAEVGQDNIQNPMIPGVIGFAFGAAVVTAAVVVKKKRASGELYTSLTEETA